jgi:hypothetical protein
MKKISAILLASVFAAVLFTGKSTTYSFNESPQHLVTLNLSYS